MPSTHPLNALPSRQRFVVFNGGLAAELEAARIAAAGLQATILGLMARALSAAAILESTALELNSFCGHTRRHSYAGCL